MYHRILPIIPKGFTEITPMQRAQDYVGYNFRDFDPDLYKNRFGGVISRLKKAEEDMGLPEIKPHKGIVGLPYFLFWDSLKFKPSTIKRMRGLTDADLAFVSAKYGIKFDYEYDFPHMHYADHVMNDLKSDNYKGRARKSLERLQEVERNLELPEKISFLMGLPSFLVQEKNFHRKKFSTMKRKYCLEDDDFLFLSAKYGIVWEENRSLFVPDSNEVIGMFYPESTRSEIQIPKMEVPWDREKSMKQSKALRAYWSIPENRELQSERIKKLWERRRTLKAA